MANADPQTSDEHEPHAVMFPKQPAQISDTSQLRTKIAETQLRLYLNPIDQVSDVIDIHRDRMGPSSLSEPLPCITHYTL